MGFNSGFKGLNDLWKWDRQSVPKSRHRKFSRRGIIQKKEYNMHNKAKLWNHLMFLFSFFYIDFFISFSLTCFTSPYLHVYLFILLLPFLSVFLPSDLNILRAFKILFKFISPFLVSSSIRFYLLLLVPLSRFGYLSLPPSAWTTLVFCYFLY